MTHSSDAFKEAERQLLVFSRCIPGIEAVLKHHLHLFFPELPADMGAREIYLTDLTETDEPGQEGQLVSHSLLDIVNTRYGTGALPSYLTDSCQVYRVPDSIDRDDLITQIPVSVLESFVNYIVTHLKWCYTNTLSFFWQAPNATLENRTPRHWLARYYMGLIQAEQSLRLSDQTLTTPESDAIVELLAHPMSSNRQTRSPTHYLGAYEVAIKGTLSRPDSPLTGAFILTQASTSGVTSRSTTFTTARASTTLSFALLYLPQSGFQSFNSLPALDLELRLRLGDEIQRSSLLNHLPEQQRFFSADHEYSLGYREIHRHLFEQRVESMIQQQQNTFEEAWASAALKGHANNVDALNDYLTDALALTRYIKPAAIEQNRYTYSLEKQLPDWLKTAPELQKIRWRQAVARLNREIGLSQTPGRPRTQQSGSKTYLLAFARDRLKQRIRQDHNIEVDPDALWLVTTEVLQTGPIVYPLGTSGYAAGNSLDRTGPTLTSHSIRRSLSELALENVGALDLTFALTANVIGADGKRHPSLTSAYLKRIVRALDIGTAYSDFLRETLLTSEAAGWRKERYTALRTAQMHLDALEATLSGQLTLQQAGWVNTLLEDNHAASISTHLLMLRDKSLPGVLLIEAQGHTPQLCYLPEAPDGIWFRTFDSLNALATQLSQHALHTYILERTSALEQAYIGPLLREGLTDANTRSQLITEDFLQASYAAEVEFALRNVDEQSTTTREANIQTIKDTVMTLVDITCFALPLKVLLPLTLTRFFYKLYQGADALQREQDHEALQHFAGSIAHLTDAASDFCGSTVFASAMRVRTPQSPQPFSPAAAAVKTREGMTLLKDTHFRQGVFELKSAQGLDTEYYLPDARDRLYQATYDRTHDTWLMIDRRKPDALYKTPAQEIMGKWQANTATALSQQDTSISSLIARAQVRHLEVPLNLPETQEIYTLDQRHYIQQNRIVFEVSANLHSSDLQLVVPGSSGAHQALLKVRRHLGTNGWEVKRAVPDGNSQWEPLTAHALTPAPTPPLTALSTYELPRRYRASAEVFLNMHARNQNPPLGALRDPYVEQARQLLHQLKSTMLRDARAFLTTFPVQARVTAPQFQTSALHIEILREIYARSPGLVIGENHFSVASKKFLIDNMAELAKHDVKTLYLEHLHTDLHQADLDIYAQQGVMSHKLNSFLKNLYKREGFDSHPAYTFLTLVTAARRHRITVRAIDCAASYHIDDLNSQSYFVKRDAVTNFYATQIIRAHQAQEGPHKWAALVGAVHANTFEGIPGIAELNGAIGLKVMDTLPGKPIGIGPDKGHISSFRGRNTGAAFYKSDLRLSMEISSSRTYWEPRERQEFKRILPHPNQYSFRNHPIEGPSLFHRNIGNDLIETPLMSDSDGTFYVQRPEWQNVHNVRFTQLNDLLQELDSKGMVLVK